MTGVIFATRREAAPFLARANGAPWHPDEKVDRTEAGQPLYEDFRPLHPMVVCICGMGPDRARAGTEQLLQQYAVTAVLNVGVAGALTDGLPVGGLYRVAKACRWPDVEIMFACREDRWTELPRAVLATAEEPVFDPLRRAAMAQHAELVDMEGAVIAQCCQARSVPCYAIKGVTDLAGTNGRQRLLQNLDKISEALAERVWLELAAM
jgi:adenosylhomocysteine nucleosidase